MEQTTSLSSEENSQPYLPISKHIQKNTVYSISTFLFSSNERKYSSINRETNVFLKLLKLKHLPLMRLFKQDMSLHHQLTQYQLTDMSTNNGAELIPLFEIETKTTWPCLIK